MVKGRSTGMSLEIHGDEQEQYRIQLEHNLQNTELSFHISTDDEQQGHNRHNNSSLEYPRHISEPSLVEFPSFAHRSREHSMHSMGDHAWSYRTADDEEGINPYGGETMSTAAHHASAVTISAGLGGGRAARTREPSLSGAEYDPDRPLYAMMSGVNSKHTMLDVDPSKSKNQMTYDPVVVDSTADLDRLLESGHAPPPMPSMRSRSVRLTAPPLSPGSSSTSEAEDIQRRQDHSSRPKLTDHLRHVSFSPSRPRTAQGFAPVSPSMRSSRRIVADESNKSVNIPTPRPSKRQNTRISAIHASKPEVRLHPATPSTVGSKFTRMAKGITKDIESTQQQISSSRHTGSSSSRPASAAPTTERNPFQDEPERLPSRPRMPTPRKSSLRDTTKSRIYLPDITGLKNAVESPLRPGSEYYLFKAENKVRDGEGRLLQTLNAVQSQLHELEEENAISRRRVRELELELEECKREVVRERTRLMEREKGDLSYRAANSKGKGKAKSKDLSGVIRPELDDERLRVRYKDAVDEKKALEALVNSLRSHLTRLTAELSSHQQLLAELRILREQDARALREKSVEILQLKEEVQRLAGEVEVLRGVVEEGLKERRASKESIQIERENDLSAEFHGERTGVQEEQEEDDAGVAQDVDDDEEEEEEDDEGQDVTDMFEPPDHVADKTMRTDRATLGESTNSKGANVQFIDDEDLDKIAAEVEERRSNISNASSGPVILVSPSPVRRASSLNNNNRASVGPVEEEVVVVDADNNKRQPSPLRQNEPSTSRTRQPSAPTAAVHIDAAAASASAPFDRRRVSRNKDAEDEGGDPQTPFPRIRGERLERLFFSAPEHNAKTCTVCYRRRYRPHGGGGGLSSPTWSKKPSATRSSRLDQKEGDDQASERSDDDDDEQQQEQGRTSTTGKCKRREKEDDGDIWYKKMGGCRRRSGEGIPPQTVLARVIRELEDDFTHYKSVYIELADQYKVMDAASDVRRRNTLAQHLREVVDILEQKGDQIASLYDLLEFKGDKPEAAAVPDNFQYFVSGMC